MLCVRRWWIHWRVFTRPGPDRFAERDALPYLPGAPQHQFDSALAAMPGEAGDEQAVPPDAPLAAGADAPGPINTTVLHGLLQGQLWDLNEFMPGEDYIVLSSGAWKKLRLWYGGGPAIEYVWVPRGIDSRNPLLIITKRLITVKLGLVRDGIEQKPLQMEVDVLVRLCHVWPGGVHYFAECWQASKGPGDRNHLISDDASYLMGTKMVV